MAENYAAQARISSDFASPGRIMNMLLKSLVITVLLALTAKSAAAADIAPTGFGALELRGDTAVSAGAAFEVSIYLADSMNVVGGFDLQIEFDYGALVFDSAVLGKHTKGQWEYFTVRSGLLRPEEENSTAAFIRLLSIADSQDPANKHPDSAALVGPGEIARLYLYATDRKDYQGKTAELKFLWNKCSDNSFSDKSGNRLMLASSAIAADGSIIKTEHYSGPAAKCFTTGYNPPTRSFTFVNFAVRIR